MLNRLSIYIGLRYSFSRRQSQLVAFISRVSTGGMLLAVSILILVTSVMNGFDKALRERIVGIVPHVTLSGYDEVSDWRALSHKAMLNKEVISAIPFSYTQGMLINGEHVKSVFLFGMDIGLEPDISVMKSLLQKEGFKGFTADFELILAEPLAQKLGIGVGDYVQLMVSAGKPGQTPRLSGFRVVHLVTTGTQLDQRLAISSLHTLSAIQNFRDKDAVNGIRLYLQDIFSAGAIAQSVRQSLGLYSVNDWTQSQGNLYQAIQMSRKLILLLVLIIVAVAAFNLVSTLILSVNEKASDIAILRTLGCSRFQILGIFLLQGAAIGIVGILMGIGVGLLLCAGLPYFVKFLESLLDFQFLRTEVYPVDYLPVDVRLNDIVMISVVAFVLSLVASILPAIRAMTIKPAKILRYE